MIDNTRQSAEFSTNRPIIVVRGLTKVFGRGDAEVHALRGIDLDIEDGADSAQLSDDIRLAFKEQYVWGVADQNRIKDISNSQADDVLTIVYALLGLSVIIAVLGVVNTLTLSIVDRVREIALLRAVGMQRSGVRRMVVQESIIITLFGTVVGVVFGVPLGLALTRYLASDGEALYVVP